MKIASRLLIVLLSLGAVACSSGGSGSPGSSTGSNTGGNTGGDNSSPAPSSPSAGTQNEKTGLTVTEDELLADTSNLIRSERALEGVGLKFHKNETQISWDKGFVESFYTAHPDAEIKNMIPPLENYVKVATAYAKKYEVFKLIKADGTMEAKKMNDAAKAEIDAKVGLSNQTITKVKAL